MSTYRPISTRAANLKALPSTPPSQDNEQLPHTTTPPPPSYVPPFTKHPEYYFPDGNIILASVENTLFRIYRGQLARHSEIFADMLMLGDPKTGDGKSAASDSEIMAVYDGCAVVHLQDSEKDLASLFALLWDVQPAKPSFATISGALHLATKYFFTNVRELCLARLKDILPTTYADLSHDFGLAKAYRSECLPQAVIQLAYDCDAPFLLPLAFYKLAIHAWTTQPPAVSRKWIGGLPPDVLTRLLLGRERMQDMWIEFISTNAVLGWDSVSAAPTTCSAETCHTGMLFPLLNSFLSVGMRSPLETLASFHMEVAGNLCRGCQNVLQEDIEAFSKRLFDDLPIIFDL